MGNVSFVWYLEYYVIFTQHQKSEDYFHPSWSGFFTSILSKNIERNDMPHGKEVKDASDDHFLWASSVFLKFLLMVLGQKSLIIASPTLENFLHKKKKPKKAILNHSKMSSLAFSFSPIFKDELSPRWVGTFFSKKSEPLEHFFSSLIRKILKFRVPIAQFVAFFSLFIPGDNFSIKHSDLRANLRKLRATSLRGRNLRIFSNVRMSNWPQEGDVIMSS